MSAPRLGIVLGSGLGAIADALTDATHTPYAELEGFPEPSVAGHGGTLSTGTLSGLPVAIFRGRKHVYETGDAYGMTVPVRWLKDQGAEAILLTNAAGSLNADVGPGRLMAISDHINLLGVEPAHGAERRGDRPALPRACATPTTRSCAPSCRPRRPRSTSRSPKASTSPPPVPRSRRRPRSARSARSARTRSGCLRFPR